MIKGVVRLTPRYISAQNRKQQIVSHCCEANSKHGYYVSYSLLYYHTHAVSLASDNHVTKKASSHWSATLILHGDWLHGSLR